MEGTFIHPVLKKIVSVIFVHCPPIDNVEKRPYCSSLNKKGQKNTTPAIIVDAVLSTE